METPLNKALFCGNLSQGMRLLGIYSKQECDLVTTFLYKQFPQLFSDNYIEWIDISPRVVSNVYGENPPEARTLLVAGSLTRGISAIGPYPNKNAALSTAVSLNFGSKNSGYYAVEQDEALEGIRQAISGMLEGQKSKAVVL